VASGAFSYVSYVNAWVLRSRSMMMPVVLKPLCFCFHMCLGRVGVPSRSGSVTGRPFKNKSTERALPNSNMALRR